MLLVWQTRLSAKLECPVWVSICVTGKRQTSATTGQREPRLKFPDRYYEGWSWLAPAALPIVINHGPNCSIARDDSNGAHPVIDAARQAAIAILR